MKVLVACLSMTLSLFLACSSAWPEVDPAVREKRLKKGKKVYRALCWACHGKTGEGDGPGPTLAGYPLPT